MSDPGNCRTAIIAAQSNAVDLFTNRITAYENLQSLFQLTPEQKEAVQAEIDEGFQSGVPTDDSEIEGNVEFIEEEFQLSDGDPAAGDEQLDFFDGDPDAGEELDIDDELEMPDSDAAAEWQRLQDLNSRGFGGAIDNQYFNQALAAMEREVDISDPASFERPRQEAARQPGSYSTVQYQPSLLDKDDGE